MYFCESMKKTISIFLSILILASSSGIAYAQHFCSGMEMMAEVTLGEKHLSCGMDENALVSDCGDESVAPERKATIAVKTILPKYRLTIILQKPRLI